MAIGVTGTLFFVLVAVSLAVKYIDSSQVDETNIGDLLAGFFAPLAFIWFLVAVLVQRSDLKLTQEALSLQAKELKNSVAQLSAQTATMGQSERNQRLDASLHLYDVALNRLADLTAGLLYNLSGVYRADEFTEDYEFDVDDERSKINEKLKGLWGRYANGDKDVFFGVLRGDLEKAGYVGVDDMINSERIRAHLRSVMHSFVETHNDAIARLVEQAAPNFMVQHLAEGSPARAKRRLESLLAATPYRSVSRPPEDTSL
jgi:hypothetical protein